MPLNYGELRDAVAGDVVGVRSRNALEPLGGPSDKVFPPTYSVPETAETRYAIESRRVNGGAGGEAVQSVVLDSVASQANRFELALLNTIRSDGVPVPVTSVDFRPITDLAGLERISDYEASHRIFDALLRDSYDGDQLFRYGSAGRAVTKARPRDAAGLYHHSPHTLVFGGWDSTGPRGGLGAKYERAITSEIVAMDVTPGVKTSSRIDLTGIERNAGPLYEAPGETWTLDVSEAVRDDKNKPKLLGAGKPGEPGRPSQANLGNIVPSIDRKAGGVTAKEIIGTTVLSFIQLRRLRFPTSPDGSLIEDRRRDAAEAAARTALAALGLAAAALAFEEGFDLRSRCVLVTSGPSIFEAISRNGGISRFELSAADAIKLIAEAADQASAAGMPWRSGELLLRPSDRLVTLIRRSHDLVAQGEEVG
jgi:CRISPR-associated protein Csb1